MSTSITASMLYDLVQCPHRVTMDLHGDPARRDPISPFVQLLWDRGHAFEQDLVRRLDIPYTELSGKPAKEREHVTAEAMARGDILIHGGRIRSGDLIGDPDLLVRRGDRYAAGDIKSGAGKLGDGENDSGKLKKHYAVQLSLYVDILEQLGKSAGRSPFVWDVRGKQVDYRLDERQGPRTPATYWNEYLDCLNTARGIATRMTQTLPALSSQCKICHWHTVCLDRLQETNDPTLIPGLGRSKRDAMLPRISTVKALAGANLESFMEGRKTIFTGIGPAALKQFQARAILQTQPDGMPYLKQRVTFPASEVELFFDIETDPLRDLCYLHGFLERRGEQSPAERYVHFFADEPTPQAEGLAFAHAWEYVRSSRPNVIYYYSPYEKTYWRVLQKRHPDVATEDEIEAMFARGSAVDLYLDVVSVKTEWPTVDYSIKTLASYLGFRWRDTEPSGAASIEWYHRWAETKDPAIRQRILEYNEDDCIATRVLLDGIRGLALRPK